MATRTFLGLMGTGAALSLARGFAIASLLDVTAFGMYAVVVACGAFASTLLSSGRIEQTMKTYPRLWADGRRTDVVASSDRTLVVLAARLLVLGAVVLLTIAALNIGHWSVALGSLLVALSVATVSLYASGQRASLDLRSMGAVTLQRAVLAIALGCLGAWWASWHGAIAGEIVGGICGTWLSRRQMIRLSVASTTALPAVPPSDSSTAARRWMFASTLAAAAPAYLDRPFVANFWGAEAAGRYGFLMLFVTGASVVAGIAAQKIGPQLVAAGHRGGALHGQIRLASRWITACGIVCLAGMSLAAWLLLDGWLAGLAHRYAIDGTTLGIATLLCCLQAAIIVEWLLISRDRERDVFGAAFVHLGAALTVCALAIAVEFSLTQFFAGLAIAKALQFGSLAFFTTRLRRRLSGVDA